MNSIKTRVWDKEFNMMEYDASDIYIDLYGNVYELESMIAMGESWQDMVYKPEYIAMMNIGIDDDDGYEIYEGDVIGTKFYNDETGKWEQALTVVEWEDNDYDYGGRCLGFDINGFWKNMHVYGNIYENPELIK